MKLSIDALRAHVVGMASSLDRVGRGWWPLYVYHFTDVRNAVNVLASGQLVSRNEVHRLGTMAHDNASQDVLSRTSASHKDYVRLYFRPLTPTQYRNEGIIPAKALVQQELRAHCPVPIFLCFDSAILCNDGVRCSDGNIASTRAQVDETAQFFSGIPWHHVYHGSWLQEHEKHEIVFRRQAEVLTSNRLGLDHLQWIVARSEAERQTLLHLLPDDVREKWEAKIVLKPEGLFLRRWPHVESVQAISARGQERYLHFRLALPTGDLHEYHLDYSYREDGSSTVGVWKGTLTTADSWSFRLAPNSQAGVATLKLDGHLAFSGRITVTDVPF